MNNMVIFVGVLPFAKANARGTKWKVLLAEESESGEGWGAFGGGPEKKRGKLESLRATAIRECDEETHGVLPPDLMNSVLSARPNSNAYGIVHFYAPVELSVCAMINGVIRRNRKCFGVSGVNGCCEKRKAKWIPLEDVMSPENREGTFYAPPTSR